MVRLSPWCDGTKLIWICLWTLIPETFTIPESRAPLSTFRILIIWISSCRALLRLILDKSEPNLQESTFNYGQHGTDESKSEVHFLVPIRSTFAKESPPKLDEALSLTKERALQHHSKDSKKPPLFGDKAQNAIHYLALLAEYELLFEAALGMYDFEISRAVARNTLTRIPKCTRRL